MFNPGRAQSRDVVHRFNNAVLRQEQLTHLPATADDGAITESDLREVVRARYRLLSDSQLPGFEIETSNLSQLAGMHGLKKWLHQGGKFFHRAEERSTLSNAGDDRV